MHLKTELCSFEDCKKVAHSRGWCAMHYQRWYKTQNPRCSIEGCENNAFSRGWCAMHYQRWYSHGDPLFVIPKPSPKPKPPPRIFRTTCEIEGCDRKHNARGLCKLHYRRWQKHGDPERVAPPRPRLTPQERRERKRRSEREYWRQPGRRKIRYERTPEQKQRLSETQRQWRKRNRGYCARVGEKYQAKKSQIPGPRNHSRWTAAEDAVIRRNDITLTEMAYMLGRSYRAVCARRACVVTGSGYQPGDHLGDNELMPGQAAKILGVAIETLAIWSNKGLLNPRLTARGHRRYDRDEIAGLMQKWSDQRNLGGIRS